MKFRHCLKFRQALHAVNERRAKFQDIEKLLFTLDAKEVLENHKLKEIEISQNEVKNTTQPLNSFLGVIKSAYTEQRRYVSAQLIPTKIHFITFRNCMRWPHENRHLVHYHFFCFTRLVNKGLRFQTKIGTATVYDPQRSKQAGRSVTKPNSVFST